jgi:hypothetical protein
MYLLSQKVLRDQKSLEIAGIEQWKNSYRENSTYLEITFHNANLSITNPTRTSLGSNPGFRGGKSTKRLSHALFASIMRVDK